MSLPVAKVVGDIDGYNLVKSKEEYGDFIVKKLAKGDEPYEIDKSIYKNSGCNN